MDDDHESDFFDSEEKKHFHLVIQTFLNYETYVKQRVDKSFNNYKELNERQRDFVPDFEENCRQLMKCTRANMLLIEMILQSVEHMFVNQKINDTINVTEEMSEIVYDMDRVCTTLKQIARDWSDFGAEERKSCYEPILCDIMRLYPENEYQLSNISVLVPGAGLGRLAFEIANLGFTCEGNEFSLYMLMASNFILNKCDKKNEYEIYPWIHQSSNNLNSKDQMCCVRFPNISINKMSSDNRFSMAAGDFLEIYNESESWNVIVTCYFIDTARNILDYVEKINFLLKPGGYWINFGPLMYHFADLKNEKSIELTYEQLKYAIIKIGFNFIKEETHVRSTYTENKNSMHRYMYDCVNFVCQKPLNRK